MAVSNESADDYSILTDGELLATFNRSRLMPGDAYADALTSKLKSAMLISEGQLIDDGVEGGWLALVLMV